MNHTTCTVNGCDRIKKSPGTAYCPMHYRRVFKHGEPGGPDPLKVTRYYVDSTCSLDGCFRLAQARGYCLMHFKRIQRNGDPGAAETPVIPFRNGVDSEGYRRIQVNGRKVKEHRHVMEQKIGRKLLPGENVHHLNGIRHDNRSENLELWVTSQTCGQRASDLLAWAHEVIDRYQSLSDSDLI
jgi:hypothetical protein